MTYPRWLALALGVLAACGFTPLQLWMVTFLAVACLIELVARASSAKRAALLGWLFGLGHFTLGNNWIATAFTYQAEMPAWLGWIAVVGLACYLALFPMLATLAAWLIARGNRIGLIFAFAGTWIITEWLRSWVFTGYVWNPLAVVGVPYLDRPAAVGLSWLAPWLGTYALSGLVVLLSGLLLMGFTLRKPWVLALTAMVVLAYYVPFYSVKDAVGTQRFTLVQPYFAQKDLDNPALYEAQFQKIAQLSLPQQRGERRLILWPESGVPDYLSEGYPEAYYRSTTYAANPLLARRRLGAVVGPGGLLLTGLVDLEMRKGEVAGARNVVTAISHEGLIVGSYAKAHLVPGGEYLPMRDLLEPLGLSRLVPGDLDFWPGPGPQTLDLGPWGRAGVQICYEIIFSGQVVDRKNRPDFIFNPSNDGWFGSWGPPQFLAQARLRAIEEGLPVLRSTTTGISAVIDARGVVRDRIEQGKAARIDGFVPRSHPPTWFSRIGNALPLMWAAILLLVSFVATRRAEG